MKYIGIAVAIIFLQVLTCEAGTVLIRKSDGFPIEYQSGDVPFEVMLKNNPDYKPDEVALETISEKEYSNLHEEKISKPFRDKNKKDRDKKADVLKLKLGFTDKEWEDLKEALK